MSNAGFFAILWCVVGLVVGSFLNVVIHRLPHMLTMEEGPQKYDLARPRSHCPHCQTPLSPWHNVPLLSFLCLRGRCAFCQAPISWRYPLVELSNAMIWVSCGLLLPAGEQGFDAAALAWACAGSLLLALALIDWETTLLPDSLTQPLLWLGLLAAEMGWSGLSLSTALWGAVLGYGSFAVIAFVFERVTGQEGLGAGDFKLLAALGAWLGALPLIPLVFLAASTGAVGGLTLRARGQLREGRYVPFGPFLALAAVVLVACGPANVLQWIGLA
jgi:leader peptidase (prepilin peptidase)/N-methyltransferase